MAVKLFEKARAVLSRPRGETLMEGVVSILVLTILLAGVTMMITMSVRMSAMATGEANDAQNEVNAALTAGDGDPEVFTFTVVVDDSETGTLKLPVAVTRTQEFSFIAFTPVDPAVFPPDEEDEP
jgi:Tfp pilus assembly protein PilV